MLEVSAQLAVEIIYVGAEDDGDNDENISKYQEQAWHIAKSSPINILSDKNLNSVAVINDEVAGALFDAWNQERYSFDVVVLPKFQQSGIGKKLIDTAMKTFRMDSEGYEDAYIKAEVANKNLIPFLTRVGFKQVVVSGGITVMTFHESLHETFISEEILRSVLWVIHPTKGLLLKPLYSNRNVGSYGGVTHEEWFDEIDLPTTGAAFDRIPRGRFELFNHRKEVVLMHHKGQFTPADIWQTASKKYKFADYTPYESNDETMERKGVRIQRWSPAKQWSAQV